MYIIVGLGNPTPKYAGTRHNVGFETVDRIASENGITMNIKKHKAICGSGAIGGVKVLLAKPQTFMNLSGESVRALMDFYKVPSDQIIIIQDDIDLPVGHLRIREKGSAGGHNGLKNIIAHLGTQDFPRIKIGVGGKPEGWDLADYVLARYSTEERKIMDEAQKSAAAAVELIVAGDIGMAMTRYNTPKKKKEKKKPEKTENQPERQETEISADTEE